MTRLTDRVSSVGTYKQEKENFMIDGGMDDRVRLLLKSSLLLDIILKD